MNKKIGVIIIIVAIALAIFLVFSGYFGIYIGSENHKPSVKISYPDNMATVSKIVTISGTASDPDGDQTLQKVEILINNEWKDAQGTTKWSYTWEIYKVENGLYSISARSWDGALYSDSDKIEITVYNPEVKVSDSHKWAIFISAANFPTDNKSKLGNGALNLAENMAGFFINQYDYSTSNMFILFDDGWIRADNGFGNPVQTLQERKHTYDITYSSATKEIVESAISYIVDEANKFSDSEVFIWIAGHGYGDINKSLTGGKILQRSEVFLWDNTLTDKELGDLLSGLKSDKTCVIVDACYSGGFADKTIYNLPEFFLLRNKLPHSGRVIITGASKFRPGYASTTEGPLFSQIWFEGLESGKADGFRRGILNSGRPTILKIFKDGKVSVEEAFYYASYVLRTDKSYKDYRKMEPQINDEYPRSGFIGSLKGLIL